MKTAPGPRRSSTREKNLKPLYSLSSKNQGSTTLMRPLSSLTNRLVSFRRTVSIVKLRLNRKIFLSTGMTRRSNAARVSFLRTTVTRGISLVTTTCGLISSRSMTRRRSVLTLRKSVTRSITWLYTSYWPNYIISTLLS